TWTTDKSIQYRGRRRLTFWEDFPHPEVGGGESDDGGLVQLAGDGGGEGQQLGQLQKFSVLLLAPRAGSVLGLLLHLLPSRPSVACEKKSVCGP
ncbi:hypothetical protein AVEN_44912-1, partial [Araneus ventricosus]